jgi:hypothetical protein
MRNRTGFAVLVAALALLVALGAAVAFAENIDPFNSGDQYAWGENVGWLNAEPANCSGCGVEVSDDDLTGYMWGENIGWINLSCQNNGTCGLVDYGVTNDGAGNLAGYAWGENVGWISFSCSNTATCGFVDYGVTIDPGTGEFSGYAWGENIGWISLSCSNTGTCGFVDYGLTTAWLQDSDGDGFPDTQDNCPNTPTIWFVPPGDSDCDVYVDGQEATIGTDAGNGCADTMTANDEDPDAWPPDFDDNQVVNITDVGKLLPPTFGMTVPPASARRDIAPNGVINITDVGKVLPPTFGHNCGTLGPP